MNAPRVLLLLLAASIPLAPLAAASDLRGEWIACIDVEADGPALTVWRTDLKECVTRGSFCARVSTVDSEVHPWECAPYLGP